MIPRITIASLIVGVLILYVGYKWGGMVFSKVGL